MVRWGHMIIMSTVHTCDVTKLLWWSYDIWWKILRSVLAAADWSGSDSCSEDEDGVGQESSTVQFQEEMSANRLHPQGSGNARGSQARLAAHAGAASAALPPGVTLESVTSPHSFWPTSGSSFQTMNAVLSEQLGGPNDNNATHLASSMALERQLQQPQPAWTMGGGQLGSLQGVPNASSFTSLQELYGQELGRSGMGSAHVKAEIGPMDQQNHGHGNSFIHCRGSELDLNYGWERYISSWNIETFISFVPC